MKIVKPFDCFIGRGLNSRRSISAPIKIITTPKIILITGYQLCELSNYSDAILSTIADETKYRSESLSSRIAQLAIIDSLYTIIMLNDEEKSKSSLHKIREAINETKE